ncbi:MAG TPA: bifunctional riboflavin kinase/FAD synthetase [Clostridia bacterium]|nr:bifunctional riboflavin kinase/FAD synthetase [Clostridia bacterium]
MYKRKKAPCAVALGCFDGLHKGHMAVVRAALSFKDRGFAPHVLLFDIHPQKILNGGPPPELLTLENQKSIVKELGLEPMIVKFEKICKMSPEKFVLDFLVKKHNVAAICCGYNYHFGSNGLGDVKTLEKICTSNDIELRIASKVEYKGSAISSTRIRQAIVQGEIEDANAMLGRCFFYDFTVVSGDKIGRLIGSPTINQHFPKRFIVPKFGVYASKTYVNGSWQASVTNIGRRPSFASDELRSETCILGFSGDLYKTNTTVCLLKYLRGEEKFANLDELKAQIKKDSASALKVFEKKRYNIT